MISLDQRIHQVILEFRRLKEGTGNTPLNLVNKTECGPSVERLKDNLTHALFELQDAYCEAHGWASTNPMCNPKIVELSPEKQARCDHRYIEIPFRGWVCERCGKPDSGRKYHQLTNSPGLWDGDISKIPRKTPAEQAACKHQLIECPPYGDLCVLCGYTDTSRAAD